MEKEGMAPAFMKGIDWQAWDFLKLAERGEEGDREVQAVVKHVADFFVTKTRKELFQWAMKNRFLLAACNTVAEVMEEPQLKARGFWLDVEHLELNRFLRCLGPYIKLSESPITIRRRAPGLGEHNREVYVEDLHLPEARLGELANLGVI